MVRQAACLELSGIAILDVDGMYSAVQTAQAGKTYSVPIVHGTELSLKSLGSLNQKTRLPLLAKSQTGYRTLASLISNHYLENKGKKTANFTTQEIKQHVRHYPHGADGTVGYGEVVALTGNKHGPLRAALRKQDQTLAGDMLSELKDIFGSNNVLVETSLTSHDHPKLANTLAELAKRHGLPLVATGSARAATPKDQALLDVLDATRYNKTLVEIEGQLEAWPSFLRSTKEMLQLHHLHPEAVANAADIAKDLAFSLNLIEPGLPDYPVPPNHTEATWLRHVTYKGAHHYYGNRTSNPEAWQLIDHELKVIIDLGFPGYFLIVKDIVDFCREEEILCQGRGSAANSAVCYALGITAVDAVKHKMLFERFLSPDRREAPDIDLDIEAQERERVIQYVYNKYGRKNAALVANVITYRPKSAVRDAGRALGYDEAHLRKWSKNLRRGRSDESFTENSSSVPDTVMEIAARLQRLPRHLGIHPGGMVLTKTPVSEVCPVKWAAMEGRTVLQWDKEDCEDAGLVKFDLLGLGMLTALQKSFTWLKHRGVTWRGRPLDLHNLPEEDPRVYALLTAAETVGVFQVESRAQMNTLPRMRPSCFYDIVVEVALIRPGPIQGNAVNPYLRRRNGVEPVTYLHPLLKPALEKTLGVPVFQEQLMQMVVDAAGFTPSQADQLRRAIGAKRSDDRLQELKGPLYEGMAQRGISKEVQEKVYEHLQGFAEFGFPESHAFSFAYLVYASSWLKVHHPEHFYAALLASQPMGFYSPASLIEDARRHGVKVTSPSVVYSNVTAEPQETSGIDTDRQPTSQLMDVNTNLHVRLGLDSIRGIKDAAERIVEARDWKDFANIADLAARARLSPTELEKLATAGALSDLGVSRREGVWSAGLVGNSDWNQPYLPGTEPLTSPSLPEMSEIETFMADYASMGQSPGRHPMMFLRPQLKDKGTLPLAALGPNVRGRKVFIAGLVTHRQRPATAKGTTFLSLEDETGLANIICSPPVWAKHRQVALNSNALIVEGLVESKDGATAVVATKLYPLRVPVPVRSRDFH